MSITTVGQMSLGKVAFLQHLRSIAIISVLVYHLGYDFFPGYLGVDIFFVISGFLIWRKLSLKPISQCSHLFQFIGSRLRRLLPLLAVASSATTIASVFVLNPVGALLPASLTGLSSIAFVSNIYLQSADLDYFGSSILSNPFLHTWSLGVEMQMYVVAAVLSIVIVRQSALVRKILLVALVATSFAVAAIMFGASSFGGLPLAAISYYSPLLRLAEFAFGAIAWEFSRQDSQTAKSNGGGFALVMVISVVSYFMFVGPATWFTLHLAVSIGTSIIIFIKSSDLGKRVSRFSGLSRIFSALGDRAYAIYVWHWPVIALGQIQFSSGPLQTIAFLIAILGLSEITYRKVEFSWSEQKTRILPIFTVAFLLIFGNIAAIHHTTLFANNSFSKLKSPTLHQDGCGLANVRKVCYLNKNGVDTVVLVGDSHALQLKEVVTQVSQEQGLKSKLISAVGCPIFDNSIERSATGQNLSACSQFSYFAVDAILSESAPIVIWASSPDYWTSGNFLSYGLENLVDELAELRDELESSNGQLVVMGFIPKLNYNPSNCSLITIANDGCFSREPLRETNSNPAHVRFSELLRQRGISQIKASDSVCPDELCLSRTGSGHIYSDSNHLTQFGASMLKDDLTGLLAIRQASLR